MKYIAVGCVLAVTLGVLDGCVPSFDPASKILGTRVIGVRVESASDPTSAWPAPGDTANVHILVVQPGPDPVHLFWSLRACALLPNPNGTPLCVGPSFPIPSGDGDAPQAGSSYEIALSSPIPELPPGIDHILLFGAVCTGGAATAGDGPGKGHCGPEATDSTLLAYRLKIAVDPASPTDHIPSFAEGAITLEGALNGAPWPPLPDGFDEATACAPGGPLPSVTPGAAAVPVAIHFDGAERESYDVSGSAPPQTAREVLQLSHFATAGKLARQFSIYEGDTTDQTVEWTPPTGAEAPPDGLVHFWLVVRDGRGGNAWAERALCVH